MNVSSSGKICALCGDDCSGKPRVKDKKGNYYCKSCHEAAAAKRRSKEAGEPEPTMTPSDGEMDLNKMALEPTSDSDPEKFNFLADFSDEHSAQVESALAIEDPTSLPAAPPVITSTPMQKQSSGSVWPKVIGILCIVFGGLGLLGILVQAVSVIPPALSAGVGAESIGSFAGIAIGAALSLWQLQGGLGVLRQQEAGANTLRRWAYTMTFIYGTCGSFILVMASMAANSDRGDVEIGEMALRITGIVVLSFMLWPLFVAIWLNRGTIKTEIDHWD